VNQTLPQDAPPGTTGASHAPTVRELFLGFLGLGFSSFGGALPLARRTIVEQRRWLSAAEFTDLLGLCQFLPGGNVITFRLRSACAFGAGAARWPACSG
jgi:chromate transporter